MSALIDTQTRKLRAQLLGAMVRRQAGEAAPQRLHFRRSVEPEESAESGRIAFLEMLGAGGVSLSGVYIANSQNDRLWNGETQPASQLGPYTGWALRPPRSIEAGAASCAIRCAARSSNRFTSICAPSASSSEFRTIATLFSMSSCDQPRE